MRIPSDNSVYKIALYARSEIVLDYAMKRHWQMNWRQFERRRWTRIVKTLFELPSRRMRCVVLFYPFPIT